MVQHTGLENRLESQKLSFEKLVRVAVGSSASYSHCLTLTDRDVHNNTMQILKQAQSQRMGSKS